MVTKIQTKGATKVCSKCGKELGLEHFGAKNDSKTGKEYRYGYCKDCERAENNARNRAKRAAARAERELSDLALYLTDESLHIQRKFKKIDQWRILRKPEHGIDLLYRDERFVKQLDLKETWVSNYSRVITKDENGEYHLLEGKYIGAVKYYTVQKNVYFKGKKKWGYRRWKVSAAELVTRTFIVNYDIKHNTKIWHKNNNKRDNYYKSLYPVTDKQYDAIVDLHRKNGTVSEEEIMRLVNAPEYKPDGWSAKYMKRTVSGVGYLAEKTDFNVNTSDVYQRWSNMLQRCYSKAVHKFKPYYKSKNVCEEWKNFQNFKIWYDEYMVPGFKGDLDKDIVWKEADLYSPETCCFVPHYVNTLFEDRGTKWMVEEKDGKFEASMSILNQKKKAGIFDTREEAEAAYCDFKKEHIIKNANKMRNKYPDYVYNAMLAWDVKKQCA